MGLLQFGTAWGCRGSGCIGVAAVWDGSGLLRIGVVQGCHGLGLLRLVAVQGGSELPQFGVARGCPRLETARGCCGMAAACISMLVHFHAGLGWPHLVASVAAQSLPPCAAPMLQEPRDALGTPCCPHALGVRCCSGSPALPLHSGSPMPPLPSGSLVLLRKPHTAPMLQEPRAILGAPRCPHASGVREPRTAPALREPRLPRANLEVEAAATPS